MKIGFLIEFCSRKHAISLSRAVRSTVLLSYGDLFAFLSVSSCFDKVLGGVLKKDLSSKVDCA